MSQQPNEARKYALNALIVDLQAHGTWTVLDGLYVFAQDTSQQAYLNLKADQYNLTVGGGTPTFVANSHSVGDGVDDWLDTNFNPVTAVGASYTQDSAHASIWSLTDNNNAGARSSEFGNTNTLLQREIAAGTAIFRMNRSSSNTAPITDFTGHLLAVRVSAASTYVKRNNVTVASPAVASTGMTSANFAIHRQGGVASFGVNQLRYVTFGGMLTSAQASTLYNALNAYNSKL